MQGRVQFRKLRHAVAGWAVGLDPMGLDPTHARALLMQGEAILDQPLASHTATDAETILLRALEIHKAQLAAAGEGPCVSWTRTRGV